MTSTRYLGSITPPPPSISVVTGGGDINTKANTWYFWLVNRCVGGFTKASATSASGVVAVGDRIDITIPSSARTSGSDVREFYVLANTINNVSTASIIASYPGYTLDGTAQSPDDYSEVLTVLPGSLSVSTDEQLELNKFITLEADLPTGVDLLNGMIRHVDEVGAYLTYNAALDDWYQLFPNTTNPNVGVTTDPVQLGCDRDIRSIAVSAKNQIITPIYGLSGSSRAVPIIIVNTGTTAILKGKPIEAQLNIGGESYLRYAVLTPRGIVDLTTGIVDTTDQPSIGGSFTGDGQGGAVIAIEKDLDAGKGFWFDVRLSFSPEDLGNQLREGALVEFYADFSPFNSKLSPDAGVFGDILGPVADHGRIVPNGPVLSPIITSRAGKVRGYVFPAQGESLGASDVIGVLANTADQNIVLTNNGIAYHAVTTPATASLRAIISTENGVGEATAFAGSYVVDATKYLTLTIAHPDTVRGDYPDIVGVQQQPAVLNAGKVRVYTRPVGGGSITYFDAVLTGGASDVVQVGQSAGTVIGSLPTVDPDFGLFTPETYVPAVSTGASVFASSTIEVAIAYLYENTMTRVTHDPLVLEVEATAQGDSSRYVRELSSSIWALFTLLDTIGFPLSTVVEAKAMTLDDLAANKLFFIAETEKIYYWNAISTAVADDDTVIAVTGIIVGRLIAVSGAGGAAVTELITADVTLSATDPRDYLILATAPIAITLPDVSTASSLAKHRLIRIDDQPYAVTINCSGTDVLNKTLLTTSFLGGQEIVDVIPDKNPSNIGYFFLPVRHELVDRKERLTEPRIFYVSSLGSDTNTGLGSSPAEALQTIKGVATKLNALDIGDQYVEVYLEPGDTIQIAPIYEVAAFAADGIKGISFVDFYGDNISPPTILFAEDLNQITVSDLIYSFYDVNIELGQATLTNAPLFISFGGELSINNCTLTNPSSPERPIFCQGLTNAAIFITDFTAFVDIFSFVSAISSEVHLDGTIALATVNSEILTLLDSKVINDAAISLAGGGRSFTLDRGTFLYSPTFIPGTAGIIKGGSRYSYFSPYNQRTVNLGTYSATTTVNWNLDSGNNPNNAVLTITNGTITLAILNAPSQESYRLSGLLDINISTGGNIILPVAWTLSETSADPNTATGIYEFVVDYNSVTTTTYVTFVPVVGGAMGSFTDPMTTRGDIIIRNASNITARLGVGTTGQVIGTDGLDVFWTTPSGGGITNLGYTASPTNGIVTSDTGTDATITLADATNAGLISPADFTKLGGIEALADVTDTTNVTAAGALMDSEVTSLSGIKTLTVPDNTTISTFGATLVDDTSASDARTTLGLGTAATQNTGTVIGNVVQLQNVGGIAGLPAVDGSLLTGLPSGFADPMTTIGDIIIRNGSNITARLGIGTSGQVLTVSSGVPTWATPSGGSFSNPVALIYPSVFTLTWSGGATMDNGAYNVFSVTVNATGTLAHSNVPAAGNEYCFRLHLTWTSGVLTFPTSWTKGMGAPSTTGGYLIEGLTIDGGTSFIIKVTYL